MEDENIKPEGVTSKSDARRKAVLKAAEKDEAKEEVVSTSVGGDSPEDNVVVSRKDLEAFLRRLESVEQENKKLIAVADKGRMFSEEERLAKESGAPLIHTVKLTRFGGGTGPIVIAWKLLDNDSFVENGRMVERQNMEVYFEDGTHDVMRLVDFYRQRDKKTRAEIIKRSRNEQTGQTEFEVQLKDGKRLTIPSAFVN